MIKLVATDIDGTLVGDGEHSLSPRMNEIILELKEKGILFVAASGRQYPSIWKLFKDVKDEMIFVAENGAYVVCRGVDIDEVVMNREDAVLLIKELRTLKDSFFTVSVKEKFYVETRDKEFLELLINGYKNEVTLVEDVLDLDLNIIKISIYNKDGADELAKIMSPKWKDKFKVVLAGHEWLDFMDLEVDKGHAIKKIQEVLNIEIEETMVFGDNINDLGMFERAKYSYAVENAREEVKAAAKYITDTNKNGGVLQILETLL